MATPHATSMGKLRQPAPIPPKGASPTRGMTAAPPLPSRSGDPVVANVHPRVGEKAPAPSTQQTVQRGPAPLRPPTGPSGVLASNDIPSPLRAGVVTASPSKDKSVAVNQSPTLVESATKTPPPGGVKNGMMKTDKSQSSVSVDLAKVHSLHAEMEDLIRAVSTKATQLLTTVEEESTRLSTQVSTISAREEAIFTSMRDLDRRETELETQQKGVEKMYADVEEELRRVREDADRAMREREEQIDKQAQEIQGKSLELLSKESNLCDREADVEAQEERVRRKNMDLVNRERSVAEREMDALQREERTQKKAADVLSREKKLMEKERELMLQEEQLRKRTVEMARRAQEGVGSEKGAMLRLPSIKRGLAAHYDLEKVIIVQRAVKKWILRRRWSQIGRQFALSKEGKILKMRNESVSELVESERVYVTSLQLVIKLFLSPLEDRVSLKKPILSMEDIRDIFSIIDVIEVVNATLLGELDQRMKQWPQVTEIGDIFRRFVPIMKLYRSYITQYKKSQDKLVETMNSNKEFADFLKQQESDPSCAGLNLQSLLIMPVQRLPRYQLLIKEVLKYTEPDHLDYCNLDLALNTVVQVLDFIDKGESLRESRLRLKQLDEQLNLPRLMGDKERRLVYECSASLLHLNVDSVKPRSPEELAFRFPGETLYKVFAKDCPMKDILESLDPTRPLAILSNEGTRLTPIEVVLLDGKFGVKIHRPLLKCKTIEMSAQNVPYMDDMTVGNFLERVALKTMLQRDVLGQCELVEVVTMKTTPSDGISSQIVANGGHSGSPVSAMASGETLLAKAKSGWSMNYILFLSDVVVLGSMKKNSTKCAVAIPLFAIKVRTCTENNLNIAFADIVCNGGARVQLAFQVPNRKVLNDLTAAVLKNYGEDGYLQPVSYEEDLSRKRSKSVAKIKRDNKKADGKKASVDGLEYKPRRARPSSMYADSSSLPAGVLEGLDTQSEVDDEPATLAEGGKKKKGKAEKEKEKEKDKALKGAKKNSMFSIRRKRKEKRTPVDKAFPGTGGVHNGDMTEDMTMDLSSDGETQIVYSEAE